MGVEQQFWSSYGRHARRARGDRAAHPAAGYGVVAASERNELSASGEIDEIFATMSQQMFLTRIEIKLYKHCNIWVVTFFGHNFYFS